jgi:hypothetical protein
MTEEPSAPPPSQTEALAWIGFELQEVDGASLGRVAGFFSDAESGEPTWLVAKLGRRRSRLVAVPIRDCAAAASCVWVAYGAKVIRTAPVVEPSRPLLREHELAISAHFAISEGVGRAAEVAARTAGSVTSRPMR